MAPVQVVQGCIREILGWIGQRLISCVLVFIHPRYNTNSALCFHALCTVFDILCFNVFDLGPRFQSLLWERGINVRL